MSEYVYATDEHKGHWLTGEEIVRCRNCVWFTNSSHYGAYCTNFGSPLGDDYDGFCAWGIKKGDNR